MSRLSLPSAASLPLELRKELSQLDLRLRWVSFVKGFGSLLFVTLLLSALFLGLDFFIPLPGLIRFAFLAMLCAVVLWLGYRWLITPLIRQRRWPELAFLIDRSFPELQERVSSTVELSMVPAEHRALASEFMTDRLRKETDRRLAGVDLWDCLSLSSMGAALAAGLVTAVIAAGPLLWNAGGYSLLWQRLLTPWQNLDSATNLTFLVEDGDRVVPRGDDLIIHARPHWRYSEGTLPREIRLTWTDEQGETLSREMAYDSQLRAYVGTISQVLAPLSYQLSSRGAQSRTYHVTVADRPRIVEANLTIHPPAYTQRPSSQHEGAVGLIRAIRGSRLVAELRFDHPVEQAQWQWSSVRVNGRDNKKQVVQGTVGGQIREDGYLAVIETVAAQSDTFRFDVVSPAGLHNVDEPQRMIQVIPDNAPRITMSGSDEPLKVQPNEILPIQLTAEDDFGVVDMQVVVEHLTNGEKKPIVFEWTSEKTGLDVRRVDDSLNLDLSLLELKSGDILGYRAVARDARPSPMPNEVWTARRVLIIDDDVKSLSGQEVEDFYEAMQRQADLVRHEVSAHRKQVERTRSELDPQPRDFAREALVEQRPDWSQTKSSLTLQLDELSRKLRERPITDALARLNADPAQELIQQAASALEKFDPKSNADPLEAIREDEKSLRKAEDLMNRLVNQLRDAERIEQELTELEQLARRSRQLANEAQQMAEGKQNDEQPEQPGQTLIDELEQEYGALEHDLKELLKRRPELKQAARNALLSELSEAANQAGDLAEQQDRLSASLEASRQQELADSGEQLTGEFAEAQRMAKELAVQSERDAEQTGDAVFNADAIGRASDEQAEANRGTAQETIEQAKAELDRYRQQKQQAAPLSGDLQQTARTLSDEANRLAEQAVAQQKQRQELAKQNRAANEAAKKTKQPIPEHTRQELAETAEKIREQDDKLASEIAGLQQAVSDLPTPPEKHWLKADTLNQLDGAQDELARQTDRSTRRLKDAKNSLERLAREVGSTEDRARNAEKPVQSVRDQADSLANRLQELKKQAQEGDAAAKETAANTANELAPQPLNQLEQLLRRDLAGKEEQLAEAAKSALQTKQQLEAGKLDEAAASQKKFVEQLDALKQALAETAAGKQPADSPTATSQKEVEQAWNDVDLPENMKQAHLPTRPEHDNQASREKVSQIAKDQAELQKQVAAAKEQHGGNTDSPQLKTKLHELANRQRQLAEQLAREQTPRGALPKMQASRAMREAADAMRDGDAEQVEKSQAQAARLLDQAEQHLQADNKPDETEALADSLEQKLNALQQQLAGQPQSAESQTSETSEGEAKPTNEQLLEQLQALRESQQRMAEQARQLAEQARLQEPDNTQRAEALEAAAEMASESQQNLKSGQMQEATQSAERATRQLESALRSESRDSTAQQTTQQLAETEQELSNQLSQLTQQSADAAAAAQQQLQQTLNNQAEDLSNLLQRLAGEAEAEPLSDRHQAGKLNELHNESAHASDSMQQALAESMQRNLSNAAEQSKQAQRQLQQLSQNAETIAGGKRDTLVPEPVGSEAADASRTLQQAKESLQQARAAMQQQQNQQANSESAPENGQLGEPSQTSPEDASQASSNGQPGSPGQASQAPQNAMSQTGAGQSGGPTQPSSPLDQLARNLAQAASSLEQAHQHMQPQQQESSSMAQQQESPSNSGNNSERDADSLGGNLGSDPMDGSLSGEALRSALMRDWGQQQGPLEADLSDARRRPIDQEYAPLIQRYFESLATPAATNAGDDSDN